jgi:uncharacterized protein
MKYIFHIKMSKSNRFMKGLFTLILAATLSIAMAQSPSFPPLDTNYRATEVRIANNLKMDVVFEGGRDAVWTGTQYGVSKTWNDFTGLMPLGTGNDSCLLIVNHELRQGARNPILGDGGGMTVFRVNKNPTTGRWNNVPYKGQKYWNVDFKGVRGTYTNCGGITLPQAGLFMTAEEVVPASNLDITGNFVDTSDFTIPSGPFKGNSYKAYFNYGWMVTVDAPNAKALYKSYAMGRAPWEGGWVAPDNKTVYLTIDNTPAPFIRFIADTVGNYEYGQLQAYKQGANGVGGTWMDLPRTWDSVSNVINVAFKRGATMFTRLEWAIANGNKLYISETGNDAASYKAAQNLGGIPSWHFQRQDTLGGLPRDTAFNDYYGRVLEFDLTTNTMRPFVEGGVGPKFTFSNPDGLSVHKQDGKAFLIVVEDINGTSQKRSGANGIPICEAFFVDLSIQNPTLNDMRPFVAGAADGELTGSVSTPDGKTIFINSQHPYLLNALAASAGSRNIAPFDNDATIAITGFSLTTPTNEVKVSESFSVYPNPASDVINFNTTTDVSLYNVSGQRIRVERNVNQINVSDLNTGIYFLQNIKGEVVKLVKQ